MYMQESKFREMKKVLLQFCDQYHVLNIPVSSPMLMEKAKEIAVK